jgi:hypothetical protein
MKGYAGMSRYEKLNLIFSMQASAVIVGLLVAFYLFWPRAKTIAPDKHNDQHTTLDKRQFVLGYTITGCAFVVTVAEVILLGSPSPFFGVFAGMFIGLMLRRLIDRKTDWTIRWDSKQVSGLNIKSPTIKPLRRNTLDWQDVRVFGKDRLGNCTIEDATGRRIVFNYMWKDHQKLLLAIGHHCPQLFPDAPT